MANKKRLIDANALLERMSVVTTDDTCPLHIAATIDQEIELAPTVDAVEVVRCKDCKYWHEEIAWCDQHSHFDKDEWNMFDKDDFCSWGERKDNEKS